MPEEISKEYLRCELTESEKKDLASKMAFSISKINELQGTLKSAKKQIESDIAKYEADLASSAERYNTGFEMREVEVSIVKDFDTNSVTVFRRDTNQIVRERALTAEERQGILDLRARGEAEGLLPLDEGREEL